MAIEEDDALLDLSVGFIGCGKMASALMEGLVREKVVADPSRIVCSDSHRPSAEEASRKGYTALCDSNDEVCTRAKNAIVIAVKPNAVETVCAENIARVPSDALVVSIAAGVRLETLQGYLPGRRIVRVMPNTPCLIGSAASGYAFGSKCDPDGGDRAVVERIFGSVGIVREMKDETLLNAVTGLSGSGPAYVYQFIEALSDGGVRAGLPRSVATELAAQTVMGAAEMVLKTGDHPGSLKDAVTSPGGTTIAGVEALEKGGFRAAAISAVTAATKRSMQMGGVSEDDIRRVHNL